MRNRDDDTILLLLVIGAALGVAATMFLVWASGMRDHHDFMSEYPRLEELISQMSDECESREGVVSCEWDEKELDFVPTEG